MHTWASGVCSNLEFLLGSANCRDTVCSLVFKFRWIRKSSWGPASVIGFYGFVGFLAHHCFFFTPRANANLDIRKSYSRNREESRGHSYIDSRAEWSLRKHQVILKVPVVLREYFVSVTRPCCLLYPALYRSS